jgi:hypothetical protein
MAGFPFGAHDEDQATDYTPVACLKSGGQTQWLVSVPVPQKSFPAHIFSNLVLEAMPRSLLSVDVQPDFLLAVRNGHIPFR